MFTKEFLQKQKIEALKTKNTAMKKVVSLTLGELSTASLGKDALIWEKDVVTEEKFIENVLNQQLKNTTASYDIFVKRGDTERAEAVKAEIEYIKRTFFPELTTSELESLLETKKAENPALTKKDWMSFLLENYKGRYNGKVASSLI